MRSVKHILLVFLSISLIMTQIPFGTFADDAVSEDRQESITIENNDPETDPVSDEEDAEETIEANNEAATEETEAKTEESAEEASATDDQEAHEEAAEDSQAPEEPRFSSDRADRLSYDPLYIMHYADSRYVDASEMDMSRFINVVTSMKGMVSYNISKQSDFEITEGNYLAGMNCEIPVYNIDDESDYYLAVPDVNKFNNEFKMFDLEVGYNNDYAELITGWKYSKGILYIPKSAIKKPSNKHSVPDNQMLAVQLNYAIGNDMDFTKKIPVQILSKDEPVNKSVYTTNIFDVSGLSVPTSVKGRKKSDIDVFLNGQMIPINEDAWQYDKKTGRVSIQALPGVVSGINIVFKHRTTLEAAKDSFVSVIENVTPSAYAAAGDPSDQAHMKYFRDESGNLVTLNVDAKDMFVGYRGYYDAASLHYGRENGQNHEEAEKYKKGLKGWESSINYLYGGNTSYAGAGSSDDESYDAHVIPLWAIASYAVGEDLGRADSTDAGTLTATEMVEHNVTKNTTKTMTIYEWLWSNKDSLKQSKKVTGNMEGNGIGGANNFAFTFPKTIIGSRTNLVDPNSPNANGNSANDGRVNQNISFDLKGINETSYYFAASCNELAKATDGSDGVNKKRVYVTCLGIGDDYVVLAFVHNVAGRKQSACAIYKFRAIMTGYVAIKKVSDRDHYSHPEHYSLEGAKYWIYDSVASANAAISAAGSGQTPSANGRVKDNDGNYIELVTKPDGSTEPLSIYPGTYYAVEVQASKGFDLDATPRPVTVSTANSYSDPAIIKSTEKAKTGYLQLIKEAKKTNVDYLEECPNNYDLDAAVFDVYTDEACTKKAKDTENNDIVITTRYDSASKQGISNTVHADIGNYYAKERTAPKGYLKNYFDKPFPETLVKLDGSNTENDPAIFFVDGGVDEGKTVDWPTVGKLPSLRKTDTTGEYGYRKMLGAQYTLRYYDVDPDTDTSTLNGKDPTRKWVFKTVEKTDKRTGDKFAGIDFRHDIPMADKSDEFFIEQVNGYKKNTLPLTSGDIDTENGIDGAKYYSIEPDGSEARVMPCGVFAIEETKAPEGMKRNRTIYYGKVYQTENGVIATTIIPTVGDELLIELGKDLDLINDESRQSVQVNVRKLNAQSKDNKAYESEDDHSAERKARFSSLGGAKYEVYYDDNDTVAPELVGVIVTDKDGNGSLTKRELGKTSMRGQNLRFGDYLISEVEPSKGFVIDRYCLSNGKQTLTPESDINVIFEYDDDEDSSTDNKTTNIAGKFKNSEKIRVIKEYDDNDDPVFGEIEAAHTFRTKAGQINTALFEYSITSMDTGTEVYISKKDIVSKEELPGATLQVISNNAEDKGTVVEEWVSTEKEHLIRELPAGDYVLREITAPYGYDVAEDVEFTVKENVIVTKAEMHNKPLKIGTTATDEQTDSHHGAFSEEETIKDVVELSGLYEGRTYKVSGKIVDKESGLPLLDRDGNEVSAESEEFVASGDTASIEICFTIDSSKFNEGSSAVVFEKLYRISTVHGEDVPIEIAKHEDLGDESQTIHYGGIAKTIAADKKDGDDTLYAQKKAILVDTVSYSNLSPKETYFITGVLYDKTSGELTEITGSKEFTPKGSDGTVPVEFKFDASKYENHSLVVFEYLFNGDRMVSKHDDVDNEDQTVSFTAPRKSPNTGDMNYLFLFTTIALIAMTVLALMIHNRNRDL